MKRMTRIATVAAAAVAIAPAAGAAGACHHDDHGKSSHGHHSSHHGSHSGHTVRYVAMGDSYAAGVGLEPLDPKSPEACRQSTSDLGHLIASSLHYSLTDVSCSGADTTDFSTPQYPGVTPAQLKALDKKTDVVTVMIGGNDSDVFSNAISACSKAGFGTNGAGSPCKDTYGDTFEKTVRTKTYPALVSTLRAVKAKAPNAKIAVVAYPRLMPKTGGCFPSMPIASGDTAYVNRLQETLNDSVKRAAKKAGVTYVDAWSASTGHDACQPVGTRWVEPVLGGVTKQPAHPNTLGEKALADLTRKALHLR